MPEARRPHTGNASAPTLKLMSGFENLVSSESNSLLSICGRIFENGEVSKTQKKLEHTLEVNGKDSDRKATKLQLHPRR